MMAGDEVWVKAKVDAVCAGDVVVFVTAPTRMPSGQYVFPVTDVKAVEPADTTKLLEPIKVGYICVRRLDPRDVALRDKTWRFHVKTIEGDCCHGLAVWNNAAGREIVEPSTLRQDQLERKEDA